LQEMLSEVRSTLNIFNNKDAMDLHDCKNSSRKGVCF
jgi:hypothetical protein